MMSGISLEYCRGRKLRAQGDGNVGVSAFCATDWFSHPKTKLSGGP